MSCSMFIMKLHFIRVARSYVHDTSPIQLRSFVFNNNFMLINDQKITGLGACSSNMDEIFHPKTLSSENTFNVIIIPKPLHPNSFIPKWLHPNDRFVRKRFHPKTNSSNSDLPTKCLRIGPPSTAPDLPFPLDPFLPQTPSSLRGTTQNFALFFFPRRPAGRRASRTVTLKKPKRTICVVHGRDPWPQFHEKTPKREDKRTKHGSGKRSPSKFCKDFFGETVFG